MSEESVLTQRQLEEQFARQTQKSSEQTTKGEKRGNLEKRRQRHGPRDNRVQKARPIKSHTTMQPQPSLQPQPNEFRHHPQQPAPQNSRYQNSHVARHINSALRHQVTLRDQGRCTHTNSRGERCEDQRWIDIHHVIPRHKGGQDTLENLTTLCSSHHRLVHSTH